jgi:hypothetical protein
MIASNTPRTSQGYEAISELAAKLGTCYGEAGVKMVCTYKGFTVRSSPPFHAISTTV